MKKKNKKQIQKFCVFMRKRDNSLHYHYSYSNLYRFSSSKVWVMVNDDYDDVRFAITYFSFDDFVFIGEFEGYKIR